MTDRPSNPFGSAIGFVTALCIGRSIGAVGFGSSLLGEAGDLEGVSRFFEDAPPRCALTGEESVAALRGGADDGVSVALRGRGVSVARELFELFELFEAVFFGAAAFLGFASFNGCEPPSIPSNPLMI